MPALRVMGFDGVVPRTSPTMLAQTQAQTSNNTKLYSQELRSWNGQLLTYSPLGIGNISTIYRLYNGSNSIWLTWTSIVDVAPGPVADVSENRIYYTGEATPRKTNYAMASASTPYPASYYEMGTPAPTGAPTVAASSSTSPVEDRVYVYTYTNLFGSVVEESAPSPASAIIALDSGATVTISGFTAPPSGNYNWQGRNIYRSVAGASTVTYEFVAYIPLATTSYVDSLTAAQLGGVIPSIGWTPPPSGLLGLISLPNGSLAGFVGNTVWISQPYYPHAWPSAYSISFPFSIVGLAALASGFVVMTARYPYMVSGTQPGNMSVQQLPLAEPCVAKSSIISNQDGVLYAGLNGLVSVGLQGAAIVTNGLFRRDEWNTLPTASMRGVAFDGKYYGVFVGAYTTSPAMVLNPKDIPMLSFLSMNARAAFNDTVTGNMYVVSTTDNNIYQVDADTIHPLTYTWTSKRFVNQAAVALGALKIDAAYEQIAATAAYNNSVSLAVTANNAAFSGPSLGQLNAVQLNVKQVNGSTQLSIPVLASYIYTQISIYGDQKLICTVTPTDLGPIRLPSFKAREIYFTLTGNMYVRSVELGTTVRDLYPKAWSESAAIPNLYT